MSRTTTLGDSILAFRDRPATAAAKYRLPSGWKEVAWPDYYKEIEILGAGLLSLGLKPGARVAIMSNTRYEWGCADFAIIGAGGATVPIYQNNTAEDVEFILNDSEAEIFICENRAVLKIWREIKDRCPKVKNVVCFETDRPDDPSLLTWEALKQCGRDYLGGAANAFRERAGALKAADMATILYTSGTTGRPKGVLITHEQIISEVAEAFPLCGVTPSDVSLSFLPYAHILGRVELWGHASSGFTLAYAESIEKIRFNLLEVKPTIMVAVPRIFEKIHSALLAQMETQPVKRKLFFWALDIGKQISALKVTRQLIPIPLLARYEVARRLVLDKVRDAFGGRLRFAISGGAPLHSDISAFFHASGVLILEGYGLTETTAAITVNTPFNYRFGSVGRPIGDVKLKIADDGEILVKSKKVMKEYYKNPQATNEVFTDGWFHTGDIGEILPGGDLRITDRKKDLIKTAGGKYVAPQRLEGLLQLSPLIAHALIHGDEKKFVVALLVLDRAYVENWAKEHGIEYGAWTDLLQKTEVQAQVRRAVTEANASLASYESIKKFLVLSQEFTVEGGELTPSLKVKRRALEKRFAAQIASLYD